VADITYIAITAGFVYLAAIDAGRQLRRLHRYGLSERQACRTSGSREGRSDTFPRKSPRKMS
jgi:hypothetical protein